MQRHIQKALSAAAFIGFLGFAPAQAASVVQVSEAAFVAGAGLITFSEFPQNTVNPTYLPGNYGGGVGSPTVTFGGFFTGQSAGASNPGACPAGAAVSGCVLGSPTGPLTLDPSSPQTFITNDASTPTTPVLSGTPTFNGSIGILFSTPQAGVGLTAGFFNAIGGTAISVFDSNGTVLGTLANSALGIEFLGLVMSDASSTIAGLLFHLVGPEPAGYVVDNIRFGVAGQVVVPGDAPLPGALPLFLTGIGALGFLAHRRKKKAQAAA